MKKRWLIVIIFLGVLSLGSLSLHANPVPGTKAVSAVDLCMQSGTLNRLPVRIACLYAFAGHVVAMLGRGRDMVAVVNGLKKDQLLCRMIPTVQQLPAPSTGGIINIEELLRTRPDIVFLKPETAKIEAELKKLERFELPYFVAGYNSMAQQMDAIEKMGEAIGRLDKAAAYNVYYQGVIDRVESETRQIPEAEKIRLYHAINEAHRTDAPGTLEADWTRACGVINVSVGAVLSGHDNKKFAGMEQILFWNPEVIIVNEADVKKLILTDKKWAALQAVQNRKVHTIPVGISRWGHPGGLETPLAILWTAKTIYPDRFQGVDLKKELSIFYQRFFDLNLDGPTLDKILSGRGMRLKKTKNSL